VDANAATFLVSDHPVCANKVAPQLFIDRAATVPQEEGNDAQHAGESEVSDNITAS
jgi:hypothetical protein